ncbi:sulfate transporter [Mycobacterium intermedium]|uniref:Sulfate transporter n=1 Tax=Mycobacterium intermedium TaxID=28445 RepID=A0A1E3SLI7_MYCIE|nr:STAS domain-containing protein [Mycobacterium intermedium]MCV6965614.1 anti-sigma factor antagonist [Mycobacterium intermedium]ODR02428.1 sulfate transporter [Mycobacterium intermedium]OPE51635.1 sulfate transporter [Mycobacterium intermedium]ORB02258.1 sulfate transporter [Mycobacterium intermedium]
MADLTPTPAILVDIRREQDATILTPEGVLDNSTYLKLRDVVIKVALDERRPVVVDVNSLAVPADAAWSVFTSARWHLSIWPDVPILLVCGNPRSRRVIASCGVTRFVPVHATRALALEAIEDHPLTGRHRACAELPATQSALRMARDLVTDWLTTWDRRELIPVAGTVATVFIENVLAHTVSEPAFILEHHRDGVTVAVEDHSRQPAIRHENPVRGADILSGLAIVSSLSRVWRSTPTPTGKTVWAVVDRENKL